MKLTPEDPYPYFYERVLYGFCDLYKPHEAHVYCAINSMMFACPGITSEDLAEMDSESKAVCEHGLSASLCNGPNHYGYDRCLDFS